MLSIFRISWCFFFQFPAFHSSWPRATSKNTPLMLQYWINSLLRCATHQKLARFFHHTSDPKPSLVLSASSHPAINVLSVFFFTRLSVHASHFLFCTYWFSTSCSIISLIRQLMWPLTCPTLFTLTQVSNLKNGFPCNLCTIISGIRKASFQIPVFFLVSALSLVIIMCKLVSHLTQLLHSLCVVSKLE